MGKRTRSKHERLHNEQLVNKFNRVSLVTDNGLLELSSRRALTEAVEEGLDLVMVSQNNGKIICKKQDYGKYLYEAKKKEKEAQRKSKKNVTKEIRLKLDTDINDMETKCRQACKFLSKGNTLKISLRIKGGINMKRKGEGGNKIKSFFDMISNEHESSIEFESNPKLSGRSWTATIVNSK